MDDRCNEKDQLVNWLEDFRANYCDLNESQKTIQECEDLLSKYNSIVGKLYIPIQIQNSIQQRESKYNLTFDKQIESFVHSIEKGLPGDSRFPDRDNTFMNERSNEYSALVDRLESFKSEFQEYSEAKEIITKAESAIDKYHSFVSSVAIPLQLQNARNARKADGSNLEYGLSYTLNQLKQELSHSMNSIDLDKAKKLNSQLIEWLENFKSQFMEQILDEHSLILDTIKEVEEVLSQYKTIIGSVTIPLAVKKSREDRSILPYGLDYQLNRFKVILSADKQSLRIDEASEYYSSLINWLEEFKLQFSNSLDINEVTNTINEVELQLKQYNLIIGGAKAKRDMNKAIESRDILPYGLHYQMKQLKNKIENKQSGKETQTLASLLMIWLEEFKLSFQYLEDSIPIINQVDDLLQQYKKQFPHDAAQSIKQQQQQKKKQKQQQSSSDDNTTATDSDDSRSISSNQNQNRKSLALDEGEDEIIPTENTSSNDSSSSSTMKEPENPPSDRKLIIPDYSSTANCFDESKLDRSVPSIVSRGEGFIQELLKKQKSLQESLGGFNILLYINWDFCSSNEFNNDLDDDNKQKACQNLVFGLLSRTVLSDTGFLGICQSNKLYKSILCSKVSLIELSYSSSSKLSNEFEISLEKQENKLNILFNLNTWNKTPNSDQIKEIYETIFELKYIHGLYNLQNQSESTGNAVQKTFSRKNPILVQIQNDFLDHPLFKDDLSLNDKLKAFDLLTKLMKNLLISSNGLCDICEKSKTTKKFVFENLREVYITYNFDNKQSSSGKQYELSFDESLGILYFTSLFSTSMKPNLDDLHIEFDRVFGLVTLKAIDISKNKIQAYQNIIKRKIKADIIVEVNWNKWISHSNFKSYSVPKQTQINQAILQNHLNEIINGQNGLIEFYNSNSNLQSILLRKLKKIEIYYDANNSIAYKHSREYPFFKLHFDHKHCTLYVIGNLNAYDGAAHTNGWKDFGDKLLPLLETSDYRFKFDATLRKYRATKMEPLLYNNQDDNDDKQVNIPSIYIDWDSFVNKYEFVTLPKAKRMSILHAIEKTHYTNLFSQIELVCAHKIGRNAIKNQIKCFYITTNENIQREKEEKLENLSIQHNQKDNHDNNSYLFIEKTGEFYNIISYNHLLENSKKKIHAWQIRWALYVSIDIAKDIGIQNMKKHCDETCLVTESKISLDFNWDYLTMNEFLSKGPIHIVSVIENTSDQLIRRILHRFGLIGICSHPIGKKCIQDNINSVVVHYSPLNDPNPKHNDSIVTIDKDNKILQINIYSNTLEAACSSRYKERIEFEYDLIVAIAKDNAIGDLRNVEDQIEKLLSKKIPIHVELDNFTQLDIFRSKIPSDQADIITCLYSTLQKQILSSTSIGLCSFLSYNVSVQPFLSQISSILFKVDPSNSLQGSEPGKIEILTSNQILQIQFNLNDVLSAVSINNWKERILFELKMLVDVSIYETSDNRKNIENQYLSSMKISKDSHEYQNNQFDNDKSVIQINWKQFVNSNEFISLHPSVQVSIIKSCNTSMLNTSLLGNNGFTGPKGLCEFNETIEFLKSKFSSVIFNIYPNDNDKFDFISHDDSKNILFISYSLHDCHKDAYIGVHSSIEKFFNLRLVKQPAAIARGDSKINNDCSSIISQYAPIIMNWNSFVDTLGLDYVQIIDEVSALPSRIFMGDMNSFGDTGISPLTSRYPSFDSALKKFQAIEVTLDPNNQINLHIGKSCSLNPTCFKVNASGNSLQIISNLNNRIRTCGCARVIQFTLCPNDAYSAEQNTIEKIAAQLTADEQHRRESAIARAHDKNNDITKQNARDQEDYQRKMQEYHK